MEYGIRTKPVPLYDFLSAWQNKPALALTDDFLIDFVRNQTVHRTNIRGIRNVSFRNGLSGIAVDLVDKNIFMSRLNGWQKLNGRLNDFIYGTPFIIPFQYISGSNNDIFSVLSSYLNSDSH